VIPHFFGFFSGCTPESAKYKYGLCVNMLVFMPNGFDWKKRKKTIAIAIFAGLVAAALYYGALQPKGPIDRPDSQLQIPPETEKKLSTVAYINPGSPCATVEACTAKAIADLNIAFCNFIVPVSNYPNELYDCIMQLDAALRLSGKGGNKK